MKNTLILMVVLLTTACQQNNLITDESTVLAQVGEVNITEQMVQAYLLNNAVRSPTEEQQTEALDALIKQQALVNLANKAGLQLAPVQQQSIDLLKDQALAQLMVQDHLKNNPVSDADVKAEYDRVTSELKGVEYHVRHLLFQDESQAIAALDEIKAGTSYLIAEQQYLQQVGQARNVGDIGWVNIKQVPEAFHQPLETLSAGQLYEQVIISRYGAHVLYLQDKRQAQPPAYDTVKAGIRKSLEQKVVERFKQLSQVKAKAVIIKDKN
ncbi:peptidyl-prolyl cis-trans isomerase [Marinicella sediminis]|uniref:peptidylprolyl isomerase n=1 Tax=Marinicella sediminis TaxID=1792834 RepID=A0ABV7JCK7_9GAMM|nr:peptidyl-prolyl cis-trans isomerase [Marinicella sediminis]